MKSVTLKCFEKNVNTMKKVIRLITDYLEMFSVNSAE